MVVDLQNILWGEFVIQDIFDTKIGKSVGGNIVNKDLGRTAYVTRKEWNNGLDGFIDYDSSYINYDSPVITIGNETAEPFVQDYPFFTGTKVNILIPKHNASKLALLFVLQSLKKHKSKYSYSFTINSTRLKRQIIQLPINSQGEPDYAFMEQYMRQKEQDKLEKYRKYIASRLEDCKDFQDVIPLNQKEWGEFFITDLFVFDKGDQNNMSSITAGSMPLVSAKKGDNGYKGFAKQLNKKIFSNNTLTLNNDGDGGAGISFYQPCNYLLDSHVTALHPKTSLGRFALLYISRCITAQRDKFGHGYSINNQRLKVFKIMLPIDKQGNPDYAYMENYMKRLEYEKLSRYLALKQA